MVGEQMVILHKEETELFDRPLFPGEAGDQRAPKKYILHMVQIILFP